MRPRHPSDGKVLGPGRSRVPQAARDRVFFVWRPTHARGLDGARAGAAPGSTVVVASGSYQDALDAGTTARLCAERAARSSWLAGTTVQAIIQRPGAAADSLILPSLARARRRSSTRLSGSLNDTAKSAGF